MATPGAFHRSTALQTLTLLSVLALLVPGRVQGRHHRQGCPSFSCGPLRNVSSPFRRPGDPPGCGSQSHELVCSYSKATIRIHDAKYYVESIDHSGSTSTFWVVDGDLDLYNNSCPLPRWNPPPDEYYFDQVYHGSKHSIEVEFGPAGNLWASFVNCSQQVKNNGMYRPVACLSTNNSFVYVLTGQDPYHMKYLEPSCGYLAMTPLGDHGTMMLPSNASLSYADVAKSMRNGFSVRFPYKTRSMDTVKECVADLISDFRQNPPSSSGIEDWIAGIFLIDTDFWECVSRGLIKPGMPMAYRYFYAGMSYTILFGTRIMKWIGVLRRY